MMRFKVWLEAEQRQFPFMEPQPGELPSIQQVNALLPQLAQAAQQVYDQWEQDEEGIDPELGGGGICQDIAEAMSHVLNIAGIDATTIDNGGMGDQHVWILAKFREGVVEVDIPPEIYERGGGYNWTKIPGIVFTPQHIHYSILDRDPESFDQYGNGS
jgi:hypothetical protein